MNDSIQRDLNKLEKTKEKILAFLRSQPAERISKNPPESWCMIQAIRHIQVSEDLSLHYIEKKSKAGDEMSPRLFKPRILLQALFFVFAVGVKFKMPRVLTGPETTSLEELEKDWKETRKRLYNFVEHYPEKWNKKAVYKHPRIGMLNLQDTIRFFDSHLKHHIIQVKRIDKMLKKS